MNRKLSITIPILLYSLLLTAQQAVPVFLPGDNGYACYRIPAIVSTGRNQLVAFAEGRKKDCNDFGNVDIVMRRSRDGGRTWSSMKVVVENDDLQAGNCAPVFDLLDPDYPEGRLLLFYNTGNATESEIRSGKGVREAWMVSSSGNGDTWSKPVNITLMVHKPLQPGYDPVYRFPQDWRGLANTPGHAVQFTGGPFKGRIYIAANHTIGPPRERWSDCFSFGYFTDDHGKTYQVSDDILIPGSNEATAAATSGGKLLLNARNQGGTPRQRIQALSSDGGVTWDTAFFHPGLIDPVCEGSLLQSSLRGKPVVLFGNPASTEQRRNLTLRASYDNGFTWPLSLLIVPGEAAYNDLTDVNRSTLGCLYEKGSDNGIYFIRVSKNRLLRQGVQHASPRE